MFKITPYHSNGINISIPLSWAQYFFLRSFIAAGTMTSAPNILTAPPK